MYDTQTDVANLTDEDQANVAEIMDYDGEQFPSVESVVEFAETLADREGATVSDELAEGAAEVELAVLLDSVDEFDGDDSDEDDTDPYEYDVL